MNKNTPEDCVQECVGSQLRDGFSRVIISPSPQSHYITSYWERGEIGGKHLEKNPGEGPGETLSQSQLFLSMSIPSRSCPSLSSAPDFPSSWCSVLWVSFQQKLFEGKDPILCTSAPPAFGARPGA